MLLPYAQAKQSRKTAPIGLTRFRKFQPVQGCAPTRPALENRSEKRLPNKRQGGYRNSDIGQPGVGGVARSKMNPEAPGVGGVARSKRNLAAESVALVLKLLRLSSDFREVSHKSSRYRCRVCQRNG